MPVLSATNLGIAGLAAIVVAASAFALRLLTLRGAVAALGIGFATFAFGGLPLAVPLLAFFFSSSLLSCLGRRRKQQAAAHFEKSGRRDAMQVLANGLVPAALAVVARHTEDAFVPWLMALAAIAAANADTWATEIGVLWRGRPRLVTTWRPADPGTSGAISPLGLLAALAGSLMVVSAGWMAWPPYSLRLVLAQNLPEFLVGLWAAFVATFGDSILGASVQAQYRCQDCGLLVERPEHCGRPAVLARGSRWVNNDAVNLATCALAAAFVPLLLRFAEQANR